MMDLGIWQQQVERLMAAVRQPNDPEPYPAASEADLRKLAAHWGAALPPSYHRLLTLHGGGIKLWFDCIVLSPWSILNGHTRAARFAARSTLTPWIFASDELGRSALAFDLHTLDDAGESPVVQLDARGEVHRWPSLPALSEDLHLRMLFGVHGHADRMYCYWTNLWTPWPSDSAESSRSFDVGRGTAHTLADDKLLAGRVDPPPANPFVTAAELAEADRRFTAAAAPVLARQCKLTVVLTSAGGMETSHGLYILYEPLADLVMGIDVVRRATTITTHDPYWTTHEAALFQVMHGVDALLRADRIADALYLGLEEACRVLLVLTGARS